MKVLLALILMFFCFRVFAETPKVIVRAEEGRWIVDVIGTATDGWPQLMQRQSFATRNQAQLQANFLKQSPLVLSNKNTDMDMAPLMAPGNLWPTTEAWSDEWEKQYAKWIENEVDSEFFVRYKVATDCADVAYSLRWIFSRMHGLPAAAGLGGSKLLMSNETVRQEWAKLPTDPEWYKDRRFLAALNYLLDMTYTHTLWVDSFPVALNRQALLSGSYHLGLHDESGHTQLIHWLSPDDGSLFLTLNSTVPRKVRPLMDSLLFADYPKENEAGILRFRWAVKTNSGTQLKRGTEMPGYSLEQFSFKADGQFPFELLKKLGFKGEQSEIRDYVVKDILELFRAREAIVTEGYEKCRQMNCSPGSQGWEDWGTPSRDSRLKGKIASLSAFPRAPFKEVGLLEIEGTTWNFDALVWNWQHEHFSSDPRDAITKRWGAGKESWVAEEAAFFKSKIAERLDKLEKGRIACQKQDCSFMTTAWKKTSSSDIDKEIRLAHEYLKGISLFPPQTQELWKSQLLLPVGKIQGQDITLQHVLRYFINMNASAAESFVNQWALGPNRPLQYYNSFSVMPYLSHWVIDNDSKEIYFAETGERILNQYQIVGQFNRTPVVLIKTEQGLRLQDLQSGAAKDFTEVPDSKDFAVASSDILVTRSPSLGLQLWKLDPVNLTLRLMRSLPDGDFELNRDFLFRRGQNIFDVRYLKELPYEERRTVLFSNDNYLLYWDKRSSAALSIDRVSGQTQRIAQAQDREEFQVLFDGKILKHVSDDRSQFYYLDDQGQTTKTQTFEGSCWVRSLNFMTCVSSAGFQHYRYENNALVPIMSGKEIFWITDSYYGKRSSEITSVYERGTNRLVLTAANIFPAIGTSFFVQPKGDDSYSILDLRDQRLPLFTNVVSGNSFIYQVYPSPNGTFFAVKEDQALSLIWRQ